MHEFVLVGSIDEINKSVASSLIMAPQTSLAESGAATTRVDSTNNEYDDNNIDNTSSTAPDTFPKKPSKLRQTCDACSETKVKCDKRSPRCGRCARLSYECVYSPARRIGKAATAFSASPGSKLQTKPF